MGRIAREAVLTEREHLPGRRLCKRYRFEHGGHKFLGTIGFNPVSQTIGEVFLQTSKSGTALEALARDSAVAVSLAIQHGCPVDIIQKAITRLDDGKAAGPVGELLDIFVRDQAS